MELLITTEWSKRKIISYLGTAEPSELINLDLSTDNSKTVKDMGFQFGSTN